MVQPVSADVLRTTCVTTGRFGFDPASAWDEIDLGFSPNDDDVQVETAPAVELLALIGLQRCQPLALEGGNLGYYAWQCPISSPIAAAGCAGAFGGSAYRYRITKRGKYGYPNWAIPVKEAAQQP